MCVIIHKPAGVEFPAEALANAHGNNPDGFGFMYYDQQIQRVVAKKTIKWTTEKIQEIVQSQKDIEACYHFRWKTHGVISDAQCHPFKILDKDRDGFDAYFMHNGVISGVKEETGESDTQAFNRIILKPLLAEKPSLIEQYAFQQLVEKFIGTGNKLCFMHSDGKVFKVNEDAGVEFEGCWVSNKYSFNKSYRSKNTTTTPIGGHNKTHNTTRSSGMVGGTATDYGNPGRGYRSSNVTNLLPGTTDFQGCLTQKGDKFIVLTQHDALWDGDGVVTSVNAWAVVIEFDYNNKKKSLSFNCRTGECFQGSGNFYAYPDKYCRPKDEGKTVGAIRKEAEASTAAEKKPNQSTVSSGSINVEPMGPIPPEKSLVKTTTTLTLTTQLEMDVADGKTATDNVIDLQEVKDNAKQMEEAVQSVDLISYKGVDVDPGVRYGGVNLVDSSADYDGTTFQDFRDLSPEERLQFFVDSPPESFNMLQDLVEYICAQDDLYSEGLEVGMMDDIHFEDDESVTPVDTGDDDIESEFKDAFATVASSLVVH